MDESGSGESGSGEDRSGEEGSLESGDDNNGAISETRFHCFRPTLFVQYSKTFRLYRLHPAM